MIENTRTLPLLRMDGMETEARLERYRQADCWTAGESLAAMLDSQMAAYHAVRQSLNSLTIAVEAAQAKLELGQGRLVYAGAGASARLAVQDGVELTPTFGWPSERIDYLIAGGKDALVRSIEGAEDDVQAGNRAVINAKLNSDDVFIGVAASGQTPFTLAALLQAKNQGSLTIALANNPNSPLLNAAHHAIPLPTGAEFLSGSTRMIAGTAQKIALNLLSTQIMMGLGKIYDGLMIDVIATNAKLQSRKISILQTITKCSELDAKTALINAKGWIKLAVLLIDGHSIEAAQLKLQQAQGRLRIARGE